MQQRNNSMVHWPWNHMPIASATSVDYYYSIIIIIIYFPSEMV